MGPIDMPNWAWYLLLAIVVGVAVAGIVYKVVQIF
jgi:hypothetical protein